MCAFYTGYQITVYEGRQETLKKSLSIKQTRKMKN